MESQDFEIYFDEMNADFEKALNYLKNEVSNIRAGRANPHVLDKIFVDYYGTPTPINQMANISVPEARMLTISVWDQSAVKNVVKAIQESDIGINPSDDGKLIRLVFPILTEERRRDLVKQVKQLSETTKVNMRNVRRDYIDIFRNMKKNNEISEDDLSFAEKDIQEVLDKYIQLVDKVIENKEKEIMEI